MNVNPDAAQARIAFSANNFNFNILKLEVSHIMQDLSTYAPIYC